MKKLLLISLMTLLSTAALAQTGEPVISADRPGMSTGTDVMPQGKIQWETGVGYESEGGAATNTLNNTLLRYGLVDWAEIRVGMDLLHEGSTTGLSALNVGTKISLVENRGWIPAISLLANLQCPRIGSSAFTPSHLAPQLYVLFQNQVTSWFNVGYNVGAEWDGTLAEPSTFAAVCLGFSITESLGCFVESYNYFHSLGNTYAMDLGLNWVVTRNLQLDLAANLNLQNTGNYLMISGGVAWLIN
ncbi:MAG: transporter [Bacteroidales bacterium]|nr:transporter [Bacteroidales bacterium]